MKQAEPMQSLFLDPPKHRAPTPLLVALAALAGLLLAGGAAGSAQAACSCRCLNGKAIPVCSSSTEIPPLCNNASCPIIPPPKTPQDAFKPVPNVTPGCQTKQVYDPKAGTYSWEQVCQ